MQQAASKARTGTARTGGTAHAHDGWSWDFENQQLIAVATVALRKAKERGFAPGYERQDWLKAEAEILAQAYGLTGAGS